MRSFVLGVSAFYHDSAICIIRDDKIIIALQEERFSRRKHDSSFPIQSIKTALIYSKIKPTEITKICFYENPDLKIKNIFNNFINYPSKNYPFFKNTFAEFLTKDKIKEIFHDYLLPLGFNKNTLNSITFFNHHESHASSAFYPSPFKESAILTLDGVGECATTSIGYGIDNKIKLYKQIDYPNSLGLLYSTITQYLGFKVNSGEYKVMGLAPYGSPKYKKIILDNIIEVFSDGSYKLNTEFFRFMYGEKMFSEKLIDLFQFIPRKEGKKIGQCHADLASSIQYVIEFVILKIVNHIKKEINSENLCMAGGVALNCVCNGKIARKQIFKNIWIQPASGDAGGALGAAYLGYKSVLGKNNLKKRSDSMKGSFLGVSFDTKSIEEYLKSIGAVYKKLNRQTIIKETVNSIAKGNIVGLFQGRMEFGPRALGGRSIIADPSNKKMQKKLNMKIKFRESFRPFAPAILENYAYDWFQEDKFDTYMLFVGKIKQDKLINLKNNKRKVKDINEIRSTIPAVTHVDNSARVQIVSEKTNKFFYDLILCFFKKKNIPILVNTSFNVRGEPIVNTIEDAFKCFMGTKMDNLVIENFFLEKNNQPKKLISNYSKEIPLD